MFDCLHDMGDPVGALKHVRAALKPNGSVMIVEPMAGGSLKDNLNPIGRLYYCGSPWSAFPARWPNQQARPWGRRPAKDSCES